jgi:inhibitor of KinA sporulation pathway (predicted exonuclease)
MSFNGIKWIEEDMKQKKLLDKTIVIDLEATCWEGEPPNGEESEIIEIGVCLLDNKTGHKSDKRGLIIQPIKSKISKFCTDLTSLTQHEVDSGMTLAKAFHILEQDYQAGKRPWCSWGDYDRRFVFEEAKSLGLNCPLSYRYFNLKLIYALKNHLDKEIGLARALKHSGIPMEGQHHRGKDDAWNTATLLWECIK